jgi:putative colanic acid biosynthesis UDP-glucose lipid carrier transferase
MGRIHSISVVGQRAHARPRFARVVDLAAGLVLLVLAAPLMAVLALAVRAGSHGRVLQREPIRDARGRRRELLSFRTTLDGGATEAHQRVRAVIGDAGLPLTPIGRLLERTHLVRLPRLVNVVAGDASFFR